MRILIQDPVGKGYFDGIAWNGGVEQALEFESVAQAETFCHGQNITRALIVVKFKDPAQDIRYPSVRKMRCWFPNRQRRELAAWGETEAAKGHRARSRWDETKTADPY